MNCLKAVGTLTAFINMLFYTERNTGSIYYHEGIPCYYFVRGQKGISDLQSPGFRLPLRY